MAEKRVLLLRMTDGDYIVCDEYYPTDSGRIHMLGDSCYAEFDLAGYTVEYKKVVRDVAAIVYSQTDWPSPIAGSKDREAILAHFNIPHV
jgi:hypothetical protein